ncbi:hypothetical protein RvY_02185-2 [Ramazzottius varieornatus]|uniref:Uncharacterized protein n=1 Tax=Ramazzottius varieornatus TaxID=947166 RepID=A0A1D1UU00_RAMVA|nr:hypothetical protein RvY_02185-2 [Ramazzottius varieornatus]
MPHLQKDPLNQDPNMDLLFTRTTSKRTAVYVVVKLVIWMLIWDFSRCYKVRTWWRVISGCIIPVPSTVTSTRKLRRRVKCGTLIGIIGQVTILRPPTSWTSALEAVSHTSHTPFTAPVKAARAVRPTGSGFVVSDAYPWWMLTTLLR